MTATTLTQGSGDTVRASVDFELDMYAGALESSTRWLDGAAGDGTASGKYPGNIVGFQATNDDTINTTGRGMKLVCARITTAPADGDTLDVGGGSDTIHAFTVGGSGAGVCTGAASGGTLTFTVSGTITAPISLWLITS